MGIKCKINIKREEKINEVLQDVQQRSRARTITVKDIVFESSLIEKYLFETLRLKKSNIIGTKVRIDINACTHTTGYRGEPMSTVVILELRAGAQWYVTEIDRCRQVIGSNARWVFVFPDIVIKQIVENISRINRDRKIFC